MGTERGEVVEIVFVRIQEMGYAETSRHGFEHLMLDWREEDLLFLFFRLLRYGRWWCWG